MDASGAPASVAEGLTPCRTGGMHASASRSCGVAKLRLCDRHMIEPSWASSAAVRRCMQANRSSGTTPELRLRSELHRRGLRFRKNLTVRANDVRTTPDIVFTRARAAVFVDGCFWHRCPQHASSPKANSDYWSSKLEANVARDRRVDAALRDDGWLVLRFWEHQSPDESADAVILALRGQRAAT